jgi:hypothetical protein
MSEPLKTITVIVDRRVLARILQLLENECSLSEDAEWEAVRRLRPEVESGDRCSLYRSDWPTAGPGGSGRSE